jgi:hypothetical protein
VRHTVPRATQNKALLWKIAGLGMKKLPVGAPCPYWYFTFFHAGNIFRSLEQDLLCAIPGKFRKSLKLKMLGKTAGDSQHRERSPGLRHFQLIQ